MYAAPSQASKLSPLSLSRCSQTFLRAITLLITMGKFAFHFSTFTAERRSSKPRDPDALSVARKLMDDCGVSYVNTDFHRDFFST